MKKFALGMAAVLTAAIVAVPLSACGGSSFDIDDYAPDPEQTLQYTATVEPTTATKVTGTVSSIFSGSSPLVTISDPDATGNNNQSLYNMETKEYVTRNFATTSILSSNFVATLVKNDDEFAAVRSCNVYTSNGEAVVTGLSSEPTCTSERVVLEGATHLLYCLTAGTSVRYFTYDTTELYGKPELKVYTEEEVEQLKSDLSVGSVADRESETKTPLGTSGMKTALSAYSCATVSVTAGRIYRFFENNEYTGELLLPTNATALGTLGTSLFYVVEDPVDQYAQKGFNVVDGDSKYNVTYYRYDIKADKLHEMDTDYYFSDDFDVLYNYAEEDTDAAVVTGYPFKDGVAYVSSKSEQSKLILGADGDVIMDISAMPYSFDNIVKLKNNRYLMSNTYIVDSDLKTIASFRSGQNVPSAERIIFSDGEGSYGLLDYDGVVTESPKWYNISFCGDKALAAKGANYSERTYHILSLGGTTQTLSQVAAASEDDTVEAANGMILKLHEGAASVYNYSGRLLTSFDDAGSYSSITRVASYKTYGAYRVGQNYFLTA